MNSPHRSEGLPAVLQQKVAYFVKLHLDTAVKQCEHSYKKDELVYSVDGKRRPMYVASVPAKRHRRTQWFIVFPITSRVCDASDRPRDDLIPIGDSLGAGRTDYLERRPLELPENLLSRDPGRSPYVELFNPLAFANAVRILTDLVYRQHVSKVFGIKL